VKTTLPIPEQDGFQVWLPSQVRFAPGVLATPTPEGFRLERDATCVAVATSRAAADSLLRKLRESGTGLGTAGLALPWRQLLEKLAVNGMLTDPGHAADPDCDSVSALDAIAAIRDTIYRASLESFATGSAFEMLLSGALDPAAGVPWLVENYHYTKSASYHIGPVFTHQLAPPEHELWRRFLKDESWHWRIYRPAFHQFNLSFEFLDTLEPHPATSDFIETLHSVSCDGPVAYAAAMTYIEQPPQCTTLDEDPLFTALIRFYGFDRAAVRPLWWHATENLTAGHSALGPVVISNRRTVARAELDRALSGVRRTIRAVSAWHEAILAQYVPAGAVHVAS